MDSAFAFNRQPFQDKDGNLRFAYPCSAWNLPTFTRCLSTISTTLAELISSRSALLSLSNSVDELEQVPSVSDWLASDPYLRQLSHYCLSLCGISPEWVDDRMLEQLLYAMPSDDGEESLPGMLVTLSLPNKKGSGSKAVSIRDSVLSLLAGASFVEGTATKAIDLLQQLDAESLNEMFRERVKIADPKAAAKQEAQDLADSINSSPDSLASYFDSMNAIPISKPPTGLKELQNVQ